MRKNWHMFFSFMLLAVSCTHKPELAQVNVDSPSEVVFDRKAEIVSLTCNINNLPDEEGTLIIEGYYWDKFLPIAKMPLKPSKEIFYQFSGDYNMGLYRLSILEVQSSRPVYFIVNGVDEKIEISASLEDFVEGKADILPKEETFCLSEAIRLHSNKTTIEDSLKRKLSSITVINPKYYTLKDSARREVELNSLSFYKDLDKLSTSFSETYINKVVIQLLRKKNRYEVDSLHDRYETEPAMLNKHYFDGIDINNKAYLGHPILYQSVNEYLIQHAGERPDEWVTSAKRMMGHISDPAIKRLISDYLVFYYLDRTQDMVAQEIAFEYIPGCTDDYIAELRKSDRYRSGPQVNGQIPLLELPDKLGKTFNVNEIIAGGEITLLYFWKSSCDYCRQEHPVIARLNELYKDKGLRIVGVSLDTDRNSWLEAIGNYDLDWLNLCDFKGISSPNIYDYAIKSTPSIYVVGKKGTLLAKDINGNELSEFFKSYFNRNN